MQFLQFLKDYWMIITAVVAVSSAWGAQEVKIREIEDVIVQQQQLELDFRTIQSQQAVIDERTKRMLESQAETNRLIRSLLMQIRETPE